MRAHICCLLEKAKIRILDKKLLLLLHTASMHLVFFPIRAVVEKRERDAIVLLLKLEFDRGCVLHPSAKDYVCAFGYDSTRCY